MKTNKTIDDIQTGARRVHRDMREAASAVKNDLEDIAHQAGQQAREFMGTAEERISNVADGMSARIQDKPIQSFGIAMGVGLILGALIFRR